MDALPIDISDPHDIRAKLPHVEARLQHKQTVLDNAEKELQALQDAVRDARTERDHWQALFAGLQAMVEPAHEDVSGSEPHADVAAESTEPSGSVDIVTSIVNAAGGEMITREVREAAAPHGLADDTVSWALWKASTLGRIRRIRRGRYAPLGSENQSEFPVSTNGTRPETAQTEETTGVHSR